ncbi:hypothetical protein [Chachezhania antarctica]|nr:hypothetical protein [Chachezhania antarctica]
MKDAARPKPGRGRQPNWNLGVDFVSAISSSLMASGIASNKGVDM